MKIFGTIVTIVVSGNGGAMLIDEIIHTYILYIYHIYICNDIICILHTQLSLVVGIREI